ncbi:MAG TPA: SDR family oxidoreductase [Terriglobales bacterium]|nr:SDR family oxidoreductase [Terriglobales bacterium]
MSTILITGASGGIGYELAKLFAKDHHELVLVARSGDKLAKFAEELQRQFGISVKAVPLDLAAPSAAQVLFEQLQRDGIAIDVLVNNAAYGVLGEFAEIPLEESLGQIQLNITALTELTRLFLGPMKERKSGKILNVASTAGFQAGPRMAVYYASKAYVISFSEALAAELEGSGVVVSCLCPGPTETGFQKRAAMEKTTLARKPGTMDAKTVALDGYRGLKAGKTLVISGMLNWLVAESVRFAPRKIVTGISKKLLESV